MFSPKTSKKCFLNKTSAITPWIYDAYPNTTFYQISNVVLQGLNIVLFS